jgi:hypothetical protein
MDTSADSMDCSAAEARHAEAGAVTTPTTNETQHEHGCQFQAAYSNNTDNQDNHRVSAVVEFKTLRWTHPVVEFKTLQIPPPTVEFKTLQKRSPVRTRRSFCHRSQMPKC